MSHRLREKARDASQGNRRSRPESVLFDMTLSWCLASRQSDERSGDKELVALDRLVELVASV